MRRRLRGGNYLRWLMPLSLGRSRRPHLHTHGGQLEGEGCGFCVEDAGAERENMVGKVGSGMFTLSISVDLSDRILRNARSGEQEPCSCLHCGRHSEVK